MFEVIKEIKDGKFTGLYIVLNNDGDVVHGPCSKEMAIDWIETQTQKLREKPKGPGIGR